jgi:serine/threonine-protein kinase
MAEIWKADAVFPDGRSHTVAIKRVKPELERNQPLYRTMFEDEARLGMLLSHPNIVRVYDARDVGGTFIMVMELVDGVALRGLIQGPRDREVGMPIGACLYITRELSRALDYAHTVQSADGEPLGIIHRDVSPHNLLLGSDGAVKLVDFGLANASIHEAEADGMVGGKLGYLAPEVIDQTGDDHRIDIFAVGIVAWEMLTGRRLFLRDSDRETVRAVKACEVPSITDLNPKVPRDVEAVILRMLERSADARYPCAADCLQAVDEVLQRHVPGVTPSDISLMVQVHLAMEAADKKQRFDISDLMRDLEEEMNVFVAQSKGTPLDLGARPLDPLDFLGDWQRSPKG